MDGRGGGGCVARYSGDGGGGSSSGGITYGMSKVEKIMLKFRPIAPKPVATGSRSGSSCSNRDGYGAGTQRRKRKYVRVNGNNTKKNIKTVLKKRNVSASSSPVSGDGDAVVTLSLMPETPDRKEISPATSSPSENLLAAGDGHMRGAEGHVTSVTNHPVLIASPSQVVSYVTMESVTDTWINGGGLRFPDMITSVMNMEIDTCPSFITNGRDTVVWTNKAYREMTAVDGTAATTVVVVVVKKYNRVAMPVSHVAFTCKVKVTWGDERSLTTSTLTAPCDVWRLQSGGYAWRLDVNAALCLGR